MSRARILTCHRLHNFTGPSLRHPLLCQFRKTHHLTSPTRNKCYRDLLTFHCFRFTLLLITSQIPGGRCFVARCRNVVVESHLIVGGRRPAGFQRRNAPKPRAVIAFCLASGPRLVREPPQLPLWLPHTSEPGHMCCFDHPVASPRSKAPAVPHHATQVKCLGMRLRKMLFQPSFSTKFYSSLLVLSITTR